MTKGELRTNQIVRDLLSEGESYVSTGMLGTYDLGTKLYTPYIPPQQGLTRPSANDPGASRATAPMKENPAMRLLRVYSFEDLERCPLDKWGIIDPGLLRRDIPGDMEREDGEWSL
jgi:5-formyltetrahydrofolate cyclo-ligase